MDAIREDVSVLTLLAEILLKCLFHKQITFDLQLGQAIVQDHIYNLVYIVMNFLKYRDPFLQLILHRKELGAIKVLRSDEGTGIMYHGSYTSTSKSGSSWLWRSRIVAGLFQVSLIFCWPVRSRLLNEICKNR